MPRVTVAERGSPPSTYCALAVVEGERGSVLKFAGCTLGRAVFIAPGIILAEAAAKRGGKFSAKDVAIRSLAASASISTVLLLYYGYQHAKALQTGKPAPWESQWASSDSLPAAPQATLGGFRARAFR